MLKLRVLTALLMAPLAVWATLALPGFWFACLLGVFFALGAWEWSRLAGLHHPVARAGYVAVFLAALVVLTEPVCQREVGPYVIAVAVVWWLAALFFVLAYPTGKVLWKSRLSRALAGYASLLPGWTALVVLHGQGAQGPHYVLFLLLLIWGADVGAYFAGHRWGRSKLAPSVSPGKTWAGVWGAMAITAVVALAAAYVLALLPQALLWWLPLAWFTVAVSIVGDLTESMFKRIADVKDSGNFLPGHGGILDRIDSLVAASPVFVMSFLLWQGLA